MFTADSGSVLASQDKTRITNTPTAQTAAHLLIKQLTVLILHSYYENSCVYPGLCARAGRNLLPVVTWSWVPAVGTLYLLAFISISFICNVAYFIYKPFNLIKTAMGY